MRIRLLSCDKGGFDASSCTRSWLFFSDHDCTSISPCTRTSPRAPALICASPLPLVSSMRTGPFTANVLSNVPSALDCGLHPANSPAKSKAAQAASEIQPCLCERVIFVFAVGRLGISGTWNGSARPPFLSEIYEDKQPEVPRAAGFDFVAAHFSAPSVERRSPMPARRARLLRLNLEQRIQRTLPVTFQIHSHKRKPRALHAFRNLSRNLRLQSPRQFLRSNLDPRQLAVRAHPKLPELQRAQHRFRTIDFLQQLRRHRDPVRHPGGKARRSWTIPRSQPSLLRKEANLSFGKCRIEQRRQHVMFVRRAMPGPEIARVIRVDPVCNGRKLPRARQRIHLLEQLVLAVITTVGIIGHVQRIFQLASFDEFVAQAPRGNKSFGLLAIVP